MLNRFIALGLQVVLVVKGYSLAAIFTANLAVGTLVLLPQAWIIYRAMPGYRPYLIRSLPEKKELYHFGFWTWLQTIIAIVSYQLDRFIIAYFLGTATVTYYVLASTIVNHLHMAFEAVVSWLLPKVSRLKAATQDTLGHFITIRAFSVGFSLLIIIALYYISEPLFTLWLGPEKYGKMIGFFRLFLVFEAFLILSIVPKYYLNAIKSLHFITWLELMYKTAIVAGMIIVFSALKTAESLIYGQILALLIFMPVEYYFINKNVLRSGKTREIILTSLPSILIMGAILFSSWYVSVACLVLAIVIFRMVYVNDERFDKKLLTE
jgi:O-antigen/teichoic acid export membrane protein